MGLFSRKKKTHVSSQTFPLAGEYPNRVKFLKTVVIGSMLRGELDSTISMSNIITSSYISGPGIKLRNYGYWLERNDYWATIGQGRSYIRAGNNVDPNDILPYLDLPENYKADIVQFEIRYADADDYALDYLLDNYPQYHNFFYLSDEEIEALDFDITLPNDENTLAENQVDIRVGEEHTIIEVPATKSEKSIIVVLSLYESDDKVTETLGEDIEETLEDDPLYVIKKDTLIVDSVPVTNYVKEIITYTDGTKEEITRESRDFNIVVKTGDKIYGTDNIIIEDLYREDLVEDIKEKDITSLSDTLKGIESRVKVTAKYSLSREDNIKRVTIKSVERIERGTDIRIYTKGSGNPDLDKLFELGKAVDNVPFYPVMPLRINSTNISPNSWGNIYKKNKSGYKKVTGQKYDTLMKQISESEGIGEINTGFLQFGVPLNTEENAAREYIFKFFDHYIEIEGSKPNKPFLFEEQYNNYVNKLIRDAQMEECLRKWSDSRGGASYCNAMYPDTTKPIDPDAVKTPGYGIYNSNMNNAGYEISFTWAGQRKITGKGLYRAGMKKGDYVVENGGTTNLQQTVSLPDGTTIRFRGVNRSKYLVTWQKSNSEWEQIQVINAQHNNHIKNGVGVTSLPFQHNDGSKESACILPINRTILKKMSLKNMTQMAVSVQYLTFTAYKVVKQKWYQTGLFKIVMIVVAIVVSIYFAPAGAGLLGANASVGAAVGLTGTAAIVVGAIANTLAAMVLSSVIQMGAKALFGDKVGAILGAVVSAITINVASGMQGGLSFAEAFNGLMRADNVMSLAQAVGKGYMESVQKKTIDMAKEARAVIENTNKRLEEVLEKSNDLFGNSVIISPLYLTDVFGGFFEGESADDFINRTLMSGSDVVEITHNIIYNFANANLDLKL